MNIRPVTTNLLLTLVSLGIGFIGIEIFFRISKPVNVDMERAILWSSPHFQIDQYNAIRYIPNEIVREVTVYNGIIEFDVTYHINNFGLIDNRDYVSNVNKKEIVNQYAFVGDSFTAGIHGGSPWVPELRDRIKTSNSNIDIYNLGVEGAGILQFYRILKSVSQQISFTDIVILAISDNFKRFTWRPIASETEIRLCPDIFDDSDCLKQQPTARIIDYNSSIEEIINIANNKSQEEKEVISTNTREVARWPFSGFDEYIYQCKRILKHSRVLLLVKETLTRRQLTAKSTRNNFKALRNIREYFPDKKIYFIHLPEKEEVETKNYKIDIKEFIESIGIEYFPALKECVWSKEMFYPSDPHPNYYGYQNISQCVSKYLFK